MIGKKFNETSLPEKEDFYSHLNVGDITDVYYAHKKEIVKILKLKIQKNIMVCLLKAIHYCYLMYLGTLEMCALK